MQIFEMFYMVNSTLLEGKINKKQRVAFFFLPSVYATLQPSPLKGWAASEHGTPRNKMNGFVPC